MKVTDGIAKQGIFILAASTLANASIFVFHIIIGNMLAPAEYGILTALLALFMIIAVPTQAIQTVIAKYTATFMAKKNFAKISYLLFRSIKKLTLYGTLLFAFFAILSSNIADFLNIPSALPVIILGAILAIALLVPVGRGVLQGLQKFSHLGVNYIIDSIMRLVFGIGLVYLGFKASGALAASFMAALIAFIFILIPLRFLRGQRGKPVDFDSSEIYKYSWPVLVTLLCFTILTNVDIILVKHFFSPVQAGYYSAASIMGKIVLYFPAAFSLVMFSKTSELHAQNTESTHVLRKTLLLVSSMCMVITLGYFAFPSFVISIYGKEFLPSAGLLGPFSIAMYLFSLINILIFYFLSVHNLRFIPILIITTIVQVTLLWFVPLSPMQVVYVLIASAFLLLTSITISQWSSIQQASLRRTIERV